MAQTATTTATATVSPRTVYLVRHARAQALDTAPDHLRQLTPTGRQEAKQMAKALRRATPAITAIYVSPYTRCVQTATPLADKLGLPLLVEPALDKLAAPDPAFSYLRPTTGAVVLVTHHENVEALLPLLTGLSVEHVPPDDIVCLERTGPTQARVVWAATPREARRVFAETEAATTSEAGHWVTLHGSGVHVYIEDGRITKGPAAFVGKSAAETTK